MENPSTEDPSKKLTIYANIATILSLLFAVFVYFYGQTNSNQMDVDSQNSILTQPWVVNSIYLTLLCVVVSHLQSWMIEIPFKQTFGHFTVFFAALVLAKSGYGFDNLNAAFEANTSPIAEGDPVESFMFLLWYFAGCIGLYKIFRWNNNQTAKIVISSWVITLLLCLVFSPETCQEAFNVFVVSPDCQTSGSGC